MAKRTRHGIVWESGLGAGPYCRAKVGTKVRISRDDGASTKEKSLCRYLHIISRSIIRVLVNPSIGGPLDQKLDMSWVGQ